MEHSEQVKKEADEVVEKYSPLTYLELPIKLRIHFAIQDRQSVLEELNSHFLMNFAYIKARKESLTAQISYLKSKIQII